MAVIYILEDDINIREIEKIALTNSGYTVYDFGNGRDFFRKLEEKKADMLILDIMLPDEDGVEILKKVRKDKRYGNIPIMMVTAKATEIDKVKGLDAGADDYIAKPFGIMELISRVKALLRRSTGNECQKILKIGDVTLDSERRVVHINSEVCELTYKEFELLSLLMSNEGSVVKREIIMEKVWGFDFEGESRTLDMHIKTLRQKLSESRAKIKTIRNVGYVIE